MDEPVKPTETVAGIKAKADAAIKRLEVDLQQIGVIAIAAAIVLPKWVPLESRIALSINGTGEETINLIGALAMSLMPEDYVKLFNEQHTNPLFLRLIEAHRASQRPTKPNMVN